LHKLSINKTKQRKQQQQQQQQYWPTITTQASHDSKQKHTTDADTGGKMTSNVTIELYLSGKIIVVF